MKRYRCKECGTGYSSVGNDIPPSAPWSDGHVCTMTEVIDPIQNPNSL